MSRSKKWRGVTPSLLRPAQKSSFEYLILPRPQDVDPILFRKGALGNVGVDSGLGEFCGRINLREAKEMKIRTGHC